MASINEYVKIIKNYLTILESSSIDKIPALKTKENRFDFNKSKLERTKTKLKQICSEELLPYKLMDGDVDKNSILYVLGLVIYNSLTDEKFYGGLEHKKIKKPFIYQFLNSTLIEEDKSIAELIEMFSVFEEDTKKIKKSNGGYIAEIFSSVGLVRQQNEDSIHVSELSSDTTLLVLADGMGGGEDGKIASSLSIDCCIEKFSSIKNIDSKTPDEIDKILRQTILEANENVLNYAHSKNIKKIGTTLTIVLIIRNLFYIGHVGDSRVYMIDSNEVKQLSDDHSVVEVLKRSNFKDKVDKYSKNILAYALGKELNENNIFTKYDHLPKKSELLICSDGFWDSVNEKYFNESFDILIDKVFDSTPNDNVSFIRYSTRKEQKKKISSKWYILIGILLIIIGMLYFAFSSLNSKPLEVEILNENSKPIDMGVTRGIREVETKGSTSSVIESGLKEDNESK